MSLQKNFTIPQNADFNISFTLTDENGDPFDLTGYAVTAQMRVNYTSNTAVNFITSHNGVGGEVALQLNRSTIQDVEARRYVYDVIIQSGTGPSSRVAEGVVTVTPGVTRLE